ncbi:hypothetical protein [Nostoc sp. 2RC]|uniref:hypothetical protein n=1 Tax=Nostoc sp. 2RC TaxID=2485484 RepID=UPI00162A94BD|nr:hypothetical protein [Nostoc sp. 2RC]MBC1241735.1 hypothetical protein [Nostoc sp. 2RC]
MHRLATQLRRIATQLRRLTTQLHRITTQLHHLATQLHRLATQLHRLATQLHRLATQLRPSQLNCVALQSNFVHLKIDSTIQQLQILSQLSDKSYLHTFPFSIRHYEQTTNHYNCFATGAI